MIEPSDLPPVKGIAESREDEETEHFAAMLYLPQPESRSGWELHGVKRERNKARRSLGFGWRKDA